jgi:SAM-dependent methyltransferase
MTHSAPESDRERFEGYYAAQKPPWDIGRPQRPFMEASDTIHGRVLDSGCGTGELALWLAERGCQVTGVDFLDGPLVAARSKAADRGLDVNFLQMDALAIGEIPERFDAVTDCGLFHVFDDAARAAYVAALTRLLEPGARVFLLCFSDAEPGTNGPRRVGEAELRRAFGSGWVVESIEPARFEVLPGIPGAGFTPGGAKAWFATIRRA